MKNFLVTGLLVVSTCFTTAAGSAQSTARFDATLPPMAKMRQRAPSGGNNPFLRTLAAVAGSAGGFALAQSQSNGEPDDIIVPMAAAVAGGAIGTMLVSNFVPGIASRSVGRGPAVGPLNVELETPAGSDFGYTIGKTREVVTILRTLPRVGIIQTTVGRDDAGGYTEAVLSANLLPLAGSNQSERELIALTEAALRPVAGVRTRVVPTFQPIARTPNPFQVIAGSVLGALPGAALAMYLVGVTEDGKQDKMLPLIAFSIPHGLLTAAFGQSR